MALQLRALCKRPEARRFLFDQGAVPRPWLVASDHEPEPHGLGDASPYDPAGSSLLVFGRLVQARRHGDNPLRSAALARHKARRPGSGIPRARPIAGYTAPAPWVTVADSIPLAQVLLGARLDSFRSEH